MSRPSYEPVNPASSTSTSNSNKSFMDYNVRIGSLFGIHIHIHYLLPAFIVITLVMWWQVISKDADHFGYYIALILLYSLVLFETVFIHELGHCFFGYLVGGESEKIIIWPLGGLAYTKPPPDSVNRGGHVMNAGDIDDSRSCSERLKGIIKVNKRMARLLIALGGPITHIPHMILYGMVMYKIGRDEHAGVTIDNAFARSQTWTQTIFIPITAWFWYDFAMLAFMLNVWLFALNFLCPAMPLDGSRIFANALRSKFDVHKSAQLYAFANGVVGTAAIVCAFLFGMQSMLLLGGAWCAFEAYNMTQLIIQSMEYTHPLMQD